jgi:hypothetical protein
MKIINKSYFSFKNAVLLFFILNLLFDLINEKILNSFFSKELVSYMFWLSIGLLLGYRLSEWERN